jgi:capsule polysaccharide modification protein KpsS
MGEGAEEDTIGIKTEWEVFMEEIDYNRRPCVRLSKFPDFQISRIPTFHGILEIWKFRTMKMEKRKRKVDLMKPVLTVHPIFTLSFYSIFTRFPLFFHHEFRVLFAPLFSRHPSVPFLFHQGT